MISFVLKGFEYGDCITGLFRDRLEKTFMASDLNNLNAP